MLNIIILYSLLYLLEIGINYKNDKLFKKTRLYYLNALQKKIWVKKYILIMEFINLLIKQIQFCRCLVMKIQKYFYV